MQNIQDFFRRQEILFIIVGGINTAISVSTFVILVFLYRGEISNSILGLISVIPSVIVGYLLQRYKVWKSKERVRKEAPKYVFVTLMQVFLNTFLLWFFTDFLRFDPLIIQGIVTFTLIFASFLIHKYWTFKPAQ